MFYAGASAASYPYSSHAVGYACQISCERAAVWSGEIWPSRTGSLRIDREHPPALYPVRDQPTSLALRHEPPRYHAVSRTSTIAEGWHVRCTTPLVYRGIWRCKNLCKERISWRIGHVHRTISDRTPRTPTTRRISATVTIESSRVTPMFLHRRHNRWSQWNHRKSDTSVSNAGHP